MEGVGCMVARAPEHAHSKDGIGQGGGTGSMENAPGTAPALSQERRVVFDTPKICLASLNIRSFMLFLFRSCPNWSMRITIMDLIGLVNTVPFQKYNFSGRIAI